MHSFCIPVVNMPSATCEVASFADSWPVQCQGEFFDKYKAVGAG